MTENGCNGGEKLNFLRLIKEACPPVRASESSAGLDIAAADDVVVRARERALVDTGLSVAVPDGCYGRIAPRSGLAVKYGIDVGAGVIDSDYRGPVKILLFNHSNEDFHVEKGMRIAQLICERIIIPNPVELNQLTDTARGVRGFGSSGMGP